MAQVLSKLLAFLGALDLVGYILILGDVDLVAEAWVHYPYCHSLEVQAPRVDGAFDQEAHHPCAMAQVVEEGQVYLVFLVIDLEGVL